jgi:hypothetical protein
VELLEEGDMDFIDDIKSILGVSSKNLAARLKFFRMAFGLNNANLENKETVVKTVQDYLHTIGNKDFPITLLYDVNSVANIKNSLLNQTFGKMKVLDLHSRDKFGHVFYNCQCLECNNTEIVRADKLVEKSVLTCSNCSNAKSLGQQKVEQWLKENNINYNTEYSFDDLIGTSGKLRFDICVFVNNRPVLIEIQGRQHYEPVEFFGGIEQFKLQQYYDNLKREYCKRNNYVLIEIPYTDFDNLEQYLLFLSF